MELWDALNNLYHKRFRYPEKDEISDKLWIINRFVSMERDLLEHIAYISKYFFTLQERYYRLLYRLIPQSFSPRTKYLKPPKELDSELLKKYSTYFGLKKKEVKNYMEILRKSYSNKELYEFVGIEYKNGSD